MIKIGAIVVLLFLAVAWSESREEKKQNNHVEVEELSSIEEVNQLLRMTLTTENCSIKELCSI